MNTAAVASHLNILESAIKEVQEWAHVLFVKFVSGRPRFVSKKVLNMSPIEKIAEKIQEFGIDVTGIKTEGDRPDVQCYPYGTVSLYFDKVLKRWELDFSRVPLSPAQKRELDDLIKGTDAPESKAKETRDWFFGASDEESF